MSWKARLKRRWPWFGIVVLAAFLRLPLLAGLGSLWNDEAFSRHFALMPIGQALRYLATDVHPPLHAVALHIWMKAFGASVLAMRSLSFLFAIAGIAVFMRLARELFGRREAFLAGILAAFSPLMVYYGADARMYAMTFFLACLSSLLFWKTAEGDDRAREAWMWVSLALALTHLTGALVLLGQGAYLFFSKERRPLFLKLFWRFLAIALVLMVWLVPAATFRLAGISKEWQFRSGQEDLHASLSLLYWIWLGKNKAQLGIAFVITGLLTFAGVLRRSERRPYFNVTRESAFLFAWLGCAFAPFLFFPNVTPRYLIAAAPPFYLLLVRGFLKTSRRRLLSLVFGVFLIVFISLPGLAVQYATRSYNWDRVAEWIDARQAPGDRVVYGWFADKLAVDAVGGTKVSESDTYGLYPFDDAFDEDERYSAHAGTLAISARDLDRMAPYFAGAERVFFIPNFYLTLREGGASDEAVVGWINAHGWFLADRLEPRGRTQGVWLLVRKEK